MVIHTEHVDERLVVILCKVFNMLSPDLMSWFGVQSAWSSCCLRHVGLDAVQDIGLQDMIQRERVSALLCTTTTASAHVSRSNKYTLISRWCALLSRPDMPRIHSAAWS
jgi:hypothetical protein